MQLNIKASIMAAVSQFKANQDICYYLEGVYVDPVEDGVVIVATNGHMLCAWRDTTGKAERPAILRIGNQLKAACGGGIGKRLTIIDGRLTVLDKDGMELFVQSREKNSDKSWEVQGKFPGWRDVIPEAKEDEPNHSLEPVNPLYLQDFQKALKTGRDEVGRTAVGISLSQPIKGGPLIVTAAEVPNFIAAVMPMRQDIQPTPAWVLLPKVAAVEETAEAA